MKRKTFITLDWENGLSKNNGTELLGDAAEFMHRLHNEGYQFLIIAQQFPAAIQQEFAMNAIYFIQNNQILNPDFISFESEQEEEESDESNLYDLVVMDDATNNHTTTEQDSDARKAKIIQKHREDPIKVYSVDNQVALYSFDDYLIISRNDDFLLKVRTLGFPTFTLPENNGFDKAKTIIDLHAFEPKHKAKSHSRFFDNKKADTRKENKRASQWVAAEALINWTYTGTLQPMHEKTLKKEPLKTFNRALRG